MLGTQVVAVDRAVETALRRWRIAGLEPVVSRGWPTDDGMRLGAALLIPVQGVTDLQTSVTRVEEEPEEARI
jgi:hypothetical protein